MWVIEFKDGYLPITDVYQEGYIPISNTYDPYDPDWRTFYVDQNIVEEFNKDDVPSVDLLLEVDGIEDRYHFSLIPTGYISIRQYNAENDLKGNLIVKPGHSIIHFTDQSKSISNPFGNKTSTYLLSDLPFRGIPYLKSFSYTIENENVTIYEAENINDLKRRDQQKVKEQNIRIETCLTCGHAFIPNTTGKHCPECQQNGKADRHLTLTRMKNQQEKEKTDPIQFIKRRITDLRIRSEDPVYIPALKEFQDWQGKIFTQITKDGKIKKDPLESLRQTFRMWTLCKIHKEIHKQILDHSGFIDSWAKLPHEINIKDKDNNIDITKSLSALDSSLSRWFPKVSEDLIKYDKHGETKYETYDEMKLYIENAQKKTFRKAFGCEIDEAYHSL